MKTNQLKSIAFIALLASAIFTLNSCNRGYGCPYELKTGINIIPSVAK
jgi:hypothetical protein